MWPRWLVAVIAAMAISAGLWQLREASADLDITRTLLGETPLTIFRPRAAGPAPVIVIAHGFAGSQQLMQPFAQTLAHHGYIAVTFDFYGHGRNPSPMRGAVGDGLAITAQLQAQLDGVASFAKTLPGSDGRLGLLGHSMASDIVIRAAMARPDVEATVAVSAFSRAATAASPRNLLVIVGALEPQMLKDEGLRLVGLATQGVAEPATRYGDFTAGTVRELVIARGVEHIGVLYATDSLVQSVGWLNAAFGRNVSGAIDHRGMWLALTLSGFLALAWPAARLLPRASPQPTGAHLAWKPFLIAAIAPAILTPLLLWKAPTEFLPILLGDYLLLHFMIYGVLTAMLTLWFGGRVMPPTSWWAVAVGAGGLALYSLITIGGTLDAYVFSFVPIPPRIALLAAMLCGTVPYFIADEWLTRGPHARRGAYQLTKLFFLLSLAAAIALNPMKLFFLAIIVPAILLLQMMFGLLSSWSYRATKHPLPGALANAFVFAWAISVTFPLIAK